MAKIRSQTKRLSLLIYGFTGGGVPRLMLSLAEALAHRGWHVDVVVIDPGIRQALPSHPAIRCVEACGWLGRNRWLRAKRKRQYRLARWSFARYLRRVRPELVLACDLSTDLVALAARERSGLDLPVIVSVHNSLTPLRIGKPKLLASVRQNFHKADAIVAVSTGIAEQLATLDLPRDLLQVLPNPVITPDFDARITAATPLLGDKARCPLILAVARLTAQKDLPTLLRAFHHLLQTWPQAELLILGEGPDRTTLRRFAEELGIASRVNVAGAVADAVPYIARVDLLALSSRQEGMPGVLIEALACGTPVVSTDCETGPRDILDHGRYGALVPVGDWQAMAAAMVQTLRDPPAPAVLRERGRQYSVERSTDAYTALFDRLLADTCRAREAPLALLFNGFVPGGIARVKLLLANAFVAEGRGVDLLLIHPAPVPPELDPRVRVIRLGGALMQTPAIHARPRRRRWLARRALTRYLRHCRPAAVLASDTRENLLALHAARKAAYAGPLVLCEHLFPSFAGRKANELEAMRREYPQAAAVIGVSRGVTENLLSLGLARERAHTIYNPVVTADFETLAAAPIMHRWLDPAAETRSPVILAAGRLVPQKDFPMLLRAFARVHARQPRARLLILGDSPRGDAAAALREQAQALGIAAVVDLPGAVPSILPYLARAQVFALSSRQEGLANVLIEALACGTPVVSTDCPAGPAEILDGGRYGRLVPVGDELAMAQALLDTLDETPDRDALRSRSRDFLAAPACAAYAQLLDTLTATTTPQH